MDVTVYGMPLNVTTTSDVLIPVVSPGSDVSVMLAFNSLDFGDLVLDVYLEREYGGTYLPVFSWVDITISVSVGNTFFGGSTVFRRNMVNTGLWRWRVVYTDEEAITREVMTYYQVQDVIRIPSTTMVKSSVGGCDVQFSSPKLSVIQDNDLSVDAFLYDNQGDPFIGLSSATGGEVRLISMETRLVSGVIPFSDIVVDDPELGDGSVRFDIPASITGNLLPGIYRIYVEFAWSDRVLEWPKLFDLNVLKQRI